MDAKSYEEIILDLLRDDPIATFGDIVERGELDEDLATESMDSLVERGRIVNVDRCIDDGISFAVVNITPSNSVDHLFQFFTNELEKYISQERLDTHIYAEFSEVPRGTVDKAISGLLERGIIIKITYEYYDEHGDKHSRVNYHSRKEWLKGN